MQSLERRVSVRESLPAPGSAAEGREPRAESREATGPQPPNPAAAALLDSLITGFAGPYDRARAALSESFPVTATAGPGPQTQSGKLAKYCSATLCDMVDMLHGLQSSFFRRILYRGNLLVSRQASRLVAVLGKVSSNTLPERIAGVAFRVAGAKIISCSGLEQAL